jgi:hypothetical protein
MSHRTFTGRHIRELLQAHPDLMQLYLNDSSFKHTLDMALQANHDRTAVHCLLAGLVLTIEAKDRLALRLIDQPKENA